MHPDLVKGQNKVGMKAPWELVTQPPSSGLV